MEPVPLDCMNTSELVHLEQQKIFMRLPYSDVSAILYSKFQKILESTK